MIHSKKIERMSKAVKSILLFYILLFLPIAMQAQVEVTEDETEDDEDEIVVTDQKGNEEIIEFPEAMTFDLDSL